ncbi:hypothetical protein Rhopal_007755-T1 [Rhodotorula paludigena]|uniref:Uncharacterized protein n=1 Tax=Rhodotorula paludigena TaxID=86838 RepID=A0AAV5GZN0_9BASI|nr:hypothetical protein Rhopal_007755-T1 [Rhodotorula paludigena]
MKGTLNRGVEYPQLTATSIKGKDISLLHAGKEAIFLTQLLRKLDHPAAHFVQEIVNNWLLRVTYIPQSQQGLLTQ